MKAITVKFLFLFGLIVATTFSLNAQPGFDDDVADTPIDGGLSLLIGAGIAYGSKKIYQFKNNNMRNGE
jgi:hypothetical protein